MGKRGRVSDGAGTIAKDESSTVPGLIPAEAGCAPAVELVVVRKGERTMQRGNYFIDRRNSRSKFYKSLHISYPNRRDAAGAKKRGASPGGDITIDGLPAGFDELGR